jgi:Mrr N-terminal domain
MGAPITGNGQGLCSTVMSTRVVQLNINSEMKKRLAEYHHTFDNLLTGADETVKRAIHRATASRIKEPHLSQKEIASGILSVLSESKELMTTAEIVKELGSELSDRLTNKDWEKTHSDRPSRWEKNARFAIYQFLKKQKMIEARSKNQWTITEIGRGYLATTSSPKLTK